MPTSPDFDSQKAHTYFSAQCFNKAWDLIDQADRTPEENEQMLLLSEAALWHWTQRPDCTGKNLSIGYWQMSRIYTLLKDAANARQAAQRCLEKTPENEPFLMGYAHEALARAELEAGNLESAKRLYVKAAGYAEQIPVKDDQELLLMDLQELEARL